MESTILETVVALELLQYSVHVTIIIKILVIILQTFYLYMDMLVEPVGMITLAVDLRAAVVQRLLLHAEEMAAVVINLQH